VDAVLVLMELMWAARDASLRVMVYLPGMDFPAFETVRREAIEKKCFEYGYHIRPRPLLRCV